MPQVKLEVNGAACAAEVEADTFLVELLRGPLGLRGTHQGCDTAQCGACTVLLDGRPVKSCNVLALQAQGHAVRTVEGLTPGRTNCTRCNRPSAATTRCSAASAPRAS